MEDETKSLSQKVYELLVAGADADEGMTLVGRIISYEDLLKIGCDISLSRTPVYQASRWLLDRKGHNLACVRGFGYQIVPPDEAPRLMGERVDKAEKQVKRGREIGEKTTRTGMSNETKTQMQAALACILGLQIEMREVARRQEFISRIVADQQQSIEELQKNANFPFTPEQTEMLRQMLAEQAKKSYTNKP